MRILIVKLSSLGDLAHALPAVHALKVRTGAELDWVTQPEYADLIRACPDVRRVIEFPRRRVWRKGGAFLGALWRDRYDWIVDLQGLMKSAAVGWLARGKRRIGPAWAREGAHRLYHRQPARRAGPRGHAVEELMDVVGLIAPGDSIPRRAPVFFPDATSDDRSGPQIGFVPFSRWTTKDWPVEKFTELGRRLTAEMGCQIRIFGGPDDQADGARLASQIGSGARSLCGQTGLPELCGMLGGLDLLVSVDSGPLHWADAMNVPVVAVYGATDPNRTGPYFQPESVLMRDGLSCRPCHARTCARGDLACLNELDAETVFHAVMARL